MTLLVALVLLAFAVGVVVGSGRLPHRRPRHRPRRTQMIDFTRRS